MKCEVRFNSKCTKSNFENDCWYPDMLPFYNIPLFNTFIMLLLPVTTTKLTYSQKKREWEKKFTTHVLTCIYTAVNSTNNCNISNFRIRCMNWCIVKTQFNILVDEKDITFVSIRNGNFLNFTNDCLLFVFFLLQFPIVFPFSNWHICHCA